MIKKAVQIGNPIVRAKSKNVAIKSIGTKKIQNLIKDLADSMKHYKLIGMAAPQIGLNLNVFVTQLAKTETRSKDTKYSKLLVFINPKLSVFSRERTEMMEGCGSLVSGQLFGPVKRPKNVTVSAYDKNGEKFEIKATGLMAKVIQHEYDHLQGVICVDKFTDTKQVMQRDEYKKRK